MKGKVVSSTGGTTPAADVNADYIRQNYPSDPVLQAFADYIEARRPFDVLLRDLMASGHSFAEWELVSWRWNVHHDPLSVYMAELHAEFILKKVGP